MTQPPYEPTREIPRIRPPRPAARPPGYVPTPETSPAQRVPARPRDYRLDPGLDILTGGSYPSPRSKNPLHVYGPAVVVVGGVVLVIALLLILLKILGVL